MLMISICNGSLHSPDTAALITALRSVVYVFRIVAYETCYCEVDLDLFHFELAFEVKLNFYMQPKAGMWHMRKAP